MIDLGAEEKAARKKDKISNFDLKSIIGIVAQQQYGCLGIRFILRAILRYMKT